jgi:anti-sigma factor RsiW
MMMECKKCQTLLSDYYDEELNSELKNLMDEHFKTCSDCNRELSTLVSSLDFLKMNMPVLTVDRHFSKQVMDRIVSAETTAAFTKPIAGIGLFLVIFILGMLALIAPTIMNLLLVSAKLLLGLLSTAKLILGFFPVIQISCSVLLGVLLLLVTFSIRRMLLHDLFN